MNTNTPRIVILHPVLFLPRFFCLTPIGPGILGTGVMNAEPELTVSAGAEDTDVSVLDSHLPFPGQLDRVENSSVALFDRASLGYRFLTERFKFLLDYSREIAGFLSISVNTVNNHRQNILEKTNTGSSPEAVRYAAGLGLL